MAVNTLTEALESAVREVARDPQSAATAASVAWTIEQVDQFLVSPAIMAARREPHRLAHVREQLSAGTATVFKGLRDMLSVAVQTEQLGGHAPWGAALAGAIERVEETFAQLGITSDSSRKTPPPIVRRFDTMGGVVWRIFPDPSAAGRTEAESEGAKEHGNPHALIHFISSLGGSGLSKIRLIKFVYLADVHEFQRTRRKATPYLWRFYHYGPWTLEVQQDIDACVAFELLDTTPYVREQEGDEIVLYRARVASSGLPAPYSASLEAALRHEVARWHREPLNLFLNYVYFDTPPMREAKRGDYLRFDSETFGPLDVTAQTTPPRKLYTTRLARAAFERLRNERPSDSVRIPRDAITDEDYERAVSALDHQDEVGDLRGDVLIEPDKLGPDPSS